MPYHIHKVASLLPLTKSAGLVDTGAAALIGLILGRAAQIVPPLQAARIDHPELYDAALSAAVITIWDQIHHGNDDHSVLLPGQSPGAMIPPPGWNLM